MTNQRVSTLLGRVISLTLPAVVAGMSTAPAAADGQHATTPVEGATFRKIAADSREVCTTISWGLGDFRTECRIETPEVNPALHGICTIYYGRRVCY
jgi:hypothetical protein